MSTNGETTLAVLGESTLTVLGAGMHILSSSHSPLTRKGTLGKAILRGILSHEFASDETAPKGTPTRFIACVTRKESARQVSQDLGSLTSHLTVLNNENVAAVQQADIVLLACKPQSATAVLSEDGMKEALAGKLLLSILAGVPSQQIRDILGVSAEPSLNATRVVRIMPNTASGIGESMTVIERPSPPLPEATRALVHWMFARIGRVVELPPHLLDASTALCGSGPAFFSLVVEAIADGGVAMGIPRKEAQLMAAQTMKGTAEMVLQGEHPALLRDKVSTPGGCTIGGLLVLEEGRVRGNMARAVREATVVAAELGKGTQRVNGTRF